jgi:tRNA dimethylallyltransferase
MTQDIYLMDSFSFNLITVLGPTATGKTCFAAKLADRLNGEIISADSRQVYKRMDIGTGKDYNDYIVAGKSIPVHLIDIVEPGYEYNVFEYQSDFVKVYNEISSRGKIPVLCGGSGLYLEAVLKGYRLINVPVNETLRMELEKKSMEEMAAMLRSFKTVHNISDLVTRKRLVRAIEIESFYLENPDFRQDYPDLKPFIIGISCDRESRRERITKRLIQRLNNGMIEEAERLIRDGISLEKMMYYGLEYKYIALFLKGELTYDEMFTDLNVAIHQFAKRQMTWFRRMERNGIKIHWIDANQADEHKLNKTLELLQNVH